MTTYQPRHERPLPAIFRGLADRIDTVGTPGYQGRHAAS